MNLGCGPIRAALRLLPSARGGETSATFGGMVDDQNDAIRYSRHSHPEVALQRDQGLCSSVVNVSEDSWNRACKAAHRSVNLGS